MRYPFDINSIARQVSVKSAVNPSLWACLVLSLPLFYLSSTINNTILIIFFCIMGTVPIVIFAVSYIYFMVKEPNFLRSEEYQLKANSLKLLGDKDNPLEANADDVIAINNPMLPNPNNKKNE